GRLHRREPPVPAWSRHPVRLSARLDDERIGSGFVINHGAGRSDREPTYAWVAPPFEGEPTGGTLYNEALSEALSRVGVVVTRVDVKGALSALRRGDSDAYWVDTLYLDAVPELVRANAGRAPIRLVVHYL